MKGSDATKQKREHARGAGEEKTLFPPAAKCQPSPFSASHDQAEE